VHFCVGEWAIFRKTRACGFGFFFGVHHFFDLSADSCFCTQTRQNGRGMYARVSHHRPQTIGRKRERKSSGRLGSVQPSGSQPHHLASFRSRCSRDGLVYSPFARQTLSTSSWTFWRRRPKSLNKRRFASPATFTTHVFSRDAYRKPIALTAASAE